MSASPDSGTWTGSRPRPRWWAVLSPTTRPGRWLLLVPAVAAAFTIAAVLYMIGVFDRDLWATDHTAGDVALRVLGVVVGAGYALLAPLAMTVVVLLVDRYGRRGLPILLVGGAVYLVATVWLLLRVVTSADYTSALLSVLYPAILGGTAALTGSIAGIVHSFRNRRAHRPLT